LEEALDLSSNRILNEFDTAVFRNVIPCSIVKCMSVSKRYATANVSLIRYDKGGSSLPSNSRLSLKSLLHKTVDIIGRIILPSITSKIFCLFICYTV
jgi:hypothetical protein